MGIPSTITPIRQAVEARVLDIGIEQPLKTQFHGFTLESEFSAIRTLAGGIPLGVQATVRVSDDRHQDIPASALFSHSADDQELVTLDRLCRAIHAANFIQRDLDGLLFLHVHSRLLHTVQEDHGRTFANVLNILGLPAGRVVLVLPVDALSPERLQAAASNYRRHGFQIALRGAHLPALRAATVVAAPRYALIPARLASHGGEALHSLLARSPVCDVIFEHADNATALAAVRAVGGRFIKGTTE